MFKRNWLWPTPIRSCYWYSELAGV